VGHAKVEVVPRWRACLRWQAGGLPLACLSLSARSLCCVWLYYPGAFAAKCLRARAFICHEERGAGRMVGVAASAYFQLLHDLRSLFICRDAPVVLVEPEEFLDEA